MKILKKLFFKKILLKYKIKQKNTKKKKDNETGDLT